MRVRMNPILFSLIGLMLMGFMLPDQEVNADTVKDIQTQIAQEKTELDKLKAKLKKHNKAILKAGAKENSVLMTLQKISNGLKMKERELKIHQYNKKINWQKIIEST